MKKDSAVISSQPAFLQCA